MIQCRKRVLERRCCVCGILLAAVSPERTLTHSTFANRTGLLPFHQRGHCTCANLAMAPKAVLIFTVQLLVCLPCLNAYPDFRARLPNVGWNSRVPAPFYQGIPDIQMTSGTTCASIGHVARCGGQPSGGGNPFGQAFVQGSSTWTTAICNADSDGDGHSNGVELGDPNCVWTAGTAPERTTCLSHPGFTCSTPTDPHCEGRTTAPQCAAQMTTTVAATMTGSAANTTGSAATMNSSAATTNSSAATTNSSAATTTGSVATMTTTGLATNTTGSAATSTGSAATMTTTGSAATTTGSAATTTGSAATTTGSAAATTGSAVTMTTTCSAATITTTGSAPNMSTAQADAASPTPSGSSGVALPLKGMATECLAVLSLAIVTMLGLF